MLKNSDMFFHFHDFTNHVDGMADRGGGTNFPVCDPPYKIKYIISYIIY